MTCRHSPYDANAAEEGLAAMLRPAVQSRDKLLCGLPERAVLGPGLRFELQLSAHRAADFRCHSLLPLHS